MPVDNKICFVVTSLQLGGLEGAAVTMANYLNSKNQQLYFITIYNFEHFYSPDVGIQLIDPPFHKKETNKLIYYFKTIKYLRKTIKTSNSNIVVSYGDWSNILTLFACLGLKTKVFISDRASPGLQFQWYVALLRKLLYPRAYGIIAQTERAAEQKINMLGEHINIKVINNPIKEVRLFPETTRKNVILGVGRHYNVKGFDRLIESFSLIDSKGFQLWIAGNSGPATEELERLVEKFNLSENVRFLGGIKDVDLLSAECKIFVLPSRSEGFPNSLIESMASGLACISYDCNAGPREIITHGEDGLLVEEGNIAQLAFQMQYLIDNELEILRLGQNALKIREKLSVDKIGKQYLDFLLS